ncbi:MAG: hypothetical protein WC215_03160 [Bacilli bacterium]
MSNSDYKNDELPIFIKRFSGEFNLEEGSFIGVNFKFRNKLYRITRCPTLDAEGTKQLKKKFNKEIGEYEVILYPANKYLDEFEWNIDVFYGMFDDINDLLLNCFIDGVRFQEIVTSSETTFLGRD